MYQLLLVLEKSGILHTIAVGLIVGLILLYFQRHIQRDRSRRRYERELVLFREKLRAAINFPSALSIGNITSSMPPAAVPIARFIAKHPIDLWRENLPRHRKSLDLLIEFRHACSLFAQASGRLDLVLEGLIRTHNASKGFATHYDPTILIYITGRILEIPTEKILHQLNDRALRRLGREWLEECLSIILADEKVKELVQLYFHARSVLSEKIELLKNELG